MSQPEFQVQVLRTQPQWLSGLAVGLDVGASGISLFATAAFDSVFPPADGSANFGDIVTDECGQTWWTELRAENGSTRWALMRNDPKSNRVERVIWLSSCGQFDPEKLWLSCEYLFILDQTGKRVLALSRDNLQPVFEIPGVSAGIDIDFDGVSTFYVLDLSEGVRIISYPLPPKVESTSFTLLLAQQPVALAAAPDGTLYILDAKLGRFIHFTPQDKSEEILGSAADPRLLNLEPSAMDIDPRGVIFVATSQPAHLYQYAPDGSYLGEAALPSRVAAISGIGFDRTADVYLATNIGVVKLSLSVANVGQSGIYYGRSLDNGDRQGLWHRLTLDANLPPKTVVEVQYATSSDDQLRATVDAAMQDKLSVQERAVKLENLLGPLWYQPAERFTGAADAVNPDMLFLRNQGRYLFFKITLKTFDQQNRPSVRSASVYYPRKSYLRYLPAAYRDDPVSAAFLERFISIFESVFRGIENEVGAISNYFDPAVARADFLPWLGSWVHLALDEDLPADRVRKLIARSPVLYQRKGTPAGLIEFLQIYTGEPVSLTEYAQSLAPLVLGTGITLGIGSVIVASSVRAYRVGDTSIVGFTPLRAADGSLAEPFQQLSLSFEIVLNIDQDTYQSTSVGLNRIIEEQKPAHTQAIIRIGSNGSMVGEARLGQNATVGGFQPYRVGYTRLGEGLAIERSRPGPLVDRGARVGSRWRLQPDR